MKHIQQTTHVAGYSTINKYLQSVILQECKKKVKPLASDFGQIRSERRSFFCPNTLWRQLEEATPNQSVSAFIRQAILEKLEKRFFVTK